MKVGSGARDTLPITAVTDQLEYLGRLGLLGVVTSTFDGRILEINETLATALGYTTAEILDQRDRDS